MKSYSIEWYEAEETLLNYQQDRLTSEQREAFEIYLIDNPQVLENLALNSLFEQYAEMPEKKFSSSNWFAFSYGVIATCGAFIFVVYLGLFSKPQSIKNIHQIVYLDTLRSSQVLTTEIEQSQQNNLVFVVAMPPKVGTKLSAAIYNSAFEDRPILQLSDVQVSNTEEAIIQVDASVLEAGDYVLIIHDKANDKEIRSQFNIGR